LASSKKIRKQNIMHNKIKPFREIQNNQIKLISLNMKYINDMWEYSKQETLYEYFEYDCHKDKKETESYLRKLIKRTEKSDCYIWFVQLKKNNKVIGSISAHDINLDRNSCEIGYAVSPDYWGKGIFSSVLGLLVNELFHYYNMHRISAKTAAENTRSIKSLEKNNFKIEGILNNYYKNSKGNRYDAILLSLICDKKPK
jgi:[ribosomal protein S5]-alanine N-acetyltransferase